MVAVPTSAGRSSTRQSAEQNRLCAVHRVERSKSDLLRFVADPDGCIVADLKNNLPGRGVWISADHASVTQAVQARAFDRSLKQKITASPKLADEVDGLLTKRVMDTLSLANKAGAAITGFTKVELAIQKQALAVLIQASDAAADGRDKLSRKFQAVHYETPSMANIVVLLTTSQLSLAMGRSNVVHAGLTDSGVARTFLSEARRLGRYRQGLTANLTEVEHPIGNE